MQHAFLDEVRKFKRDPVLGSSRALGSGARRRFAGGALWLGRFAVKRNRRLALAVEHAMSCTVPIIRCSNGRGESRSAIVLRVLWPLAALVFIICAVVAKASGPGPVKGGALPLPTSLSPTNNWWNYDISTAPVNPSSTACIAFINNNGGSRQLHPCMGGGVSPGSVDICGMPYVVVDATQPKVPVQNQ